MKSSLRIAYAATFMSIVSIMNAPMASAAAEMVVVHAENAPFKRGAIIDGSVPVTLKSGSSITLVSSDGSFVTLTGPVRRVPASGSPARANDPKLLKALKALVAAEEMSTASLGVVRSGASKSDDVPVPHAWAVNVADSGARCVQGNSVTFWRRNAHQRVRMNIRSAQGGRSARVNWPAGRDMLRMNGSGFRNGDRYIVEMGGHRVELAMHVLPANLTSPVQQAVWMARSGCRAQAMAMLKNVR